MDTFDAMAFARRAHQHHFRKYTGEPYFAHLAEVAGLVAVVLDRMPIVDPRAAVAVAYLHDTMEDQDVKFAELEALFGFEVANGVNFLTAPGLPYGNRRVRKAHEANQLAKAPAWIQTVKVADLISNTASIVKHDPVFAKVYLEEKRDLLDHYLLLADPRLVSIARSQL